MAARKLHVTIEELETIDSMSPRQFEFLSNYHDYDVHLLHGTAGTGKTFLALYRALEDVLDKGTYFEKLIIVRSAVPGRPIGALPGNIDEKGNPYEMVYQSMCKDLLGRADAYDRMKEQRILEFKLTSFIRGITLDRCVVIVDEVQNLDYQELYTCITRVGVGTKMLFCGDTKQNDLNGKSGLDKFMKVLYNMPSCHQVEFGIDDIVRSDLIKEFLIAESKL